MNDLEQISQGDKENKLEDKQNEQLSFFPAHEKVESKMNEEKEKLIQQVASLNLLNMTPLEAMNVLYEIHERALNETKKR